MGQLTEGFVRGMLARTDPNRSDHGQHQPLTVWEEHQLAHAWLALTTATARVKELEARLAAVHSFLTNDALAGTYQSVGQYRAAAINEVSNAFIAALRAKEGGNGRANQRRK